MILVPRGTLHPPFFTAILHQSWRASHSFYRAIGMVVRSWGSYLKWDLLCTGHLYSYLKSRFLCDTLGTMRTSLPSFQLGIYINLHGAWNTQPSGRSRARWRAKDEACVVSTPTFTCRAISGKHYAPKPPHPPQALHLVAQRDLGPTTWYHQPRS